LALIEVWPADVATHVLRKSIKRHFRSAQAAFPDENFVCGSDSRNHVSRVLRDIGRKSFSETSCVALIQVLASAHFPSPFSTRALFCTMSFDELDYRAKLMFNQTKL
jgi:hypothetical protein